MSDSSADAPAGDNVLLVKGGEWAGSCGHEAGLARADFA